MKKNSKKLVKLTFPQKLIKKPLIFKMAKKFDLMPNIRRAKITDEIGEVVLEIDGIAESLQKGIKYLIKEGVIVEPIVGDIIE